MADSVQEGDFAINDNLGNCWGAQCSSEQGMTQCSVAIVIADH